MLQQPFFASPFQDVAFLTMDGVEWSTTSFGIGNGNKMKIMADIKFPNFRFVIFSNNILYWFSC